MGRGLGCGTAWRLHEYKGVNEANILPSIPCTHQTHLQGHKGEWSTGETQQICIIGNRQDVSLGVGPEQSRRASTSTHLRTGRYPAIFREWELQ